MVVVIPPVAGETVVVDETPAEPAPVEASPTVAEAAPLVVEAVPAAPPSPIVAPEAVAVDAAESGKTVPPPAPAPVVPAGALETALIESGLILVQTTVRAAVVSAEPAPRLGRPRKQQPHAAAADEGPLVMIETAKQADQTR